jgi:hypothetical protein
MIQNPTRREFITKGFHLCMGCTLVLSGCKSGADNPSGHGGMENEINSYTYCGYNCEGCDFLKATLENDLDLKKDVYTRWKWKERLNVDFDENIVFCWGCKPPKGKPINIFQKQCSVRTCALEKDKKNCILCDELVVCQKELWDRFPAHKQAVIDLQKKYISQGLKL